MAKTKSKKKRQQQTELAKSKKQNNKNNNNNAQVSKMSLEEKNYNKNSKKILEEEMRLKKFKWVFYVGFGIAILSILLNFLPMIEVFNTGINGAEVSVTGFNFLLAFITGQYESADGIYGDIAIPFYYWNKGKTVVLTIFVVLAFALLIATLVMSILVAFRKKKTNKGLLTTITGFLAGSTALCYLLAFIIALSQSEVILKEYCSNNPECSIRSFAILLFIFMSAISAGYIYFGFKTLPLDKLIKQNTEYKKIIDKQKQYADNTASI